MPNRLVVRLLGPFKVEAPGGHIAPFEATTARGLLAYLAANREQPQLRSELAAVLWGADSVPTGLTNLRSALRRVRNAVILADGATPCLLAGRDTAQLNPDVRTEIDTELFEAHLRFVQLHSHPSVYECRECVERQRQAIVLYRGDFLADLDIPNEHFEQWRAGEQDWHRHQMVRALCNLAEHEVRQGSWEEAERLVRRQLALEPWNEESHRQLMRILLASGRRSVALTQYEICCRILNTELNAAPSEETDALYTHILAGEAPPALHPARNPYKSLDAFGAEDAANFFGRESVIKQLLASVRVQPLVALIGPSGSGKSSVVHAGLTRALAADRQGGHGEAEIASVQWRIAHLRPGSAPLNALADALIALGYAPETPGTLDKLLRRHQITLPLLLAGESMEAQNAGKADGVREAIRYLLIVDQFEEIFTLCHDAAVRSAFLHFLLSTLNDLDPGVVSAAVLLTIRADFMGEVLQQHELAAALQNRTMLLGPMERRELQRAIEEPARLQGVMFEPGLVERLLDEVGSEPGRLPLLQFALAMMWLRQQGGWLTHASYDAIGGVRGALADYSDEVYLQLSSPEQQAARTVFLALVEPGLNAQDVRRLATRAEIGEANWPIVQRLADARLLVTSSSLDREETVELAHEALIREWTRLRDWLESDRVFRNWQQQMRVADEHWRQSDYEDGALLQGARLAEAERWLTDRSTDINLLVRRYVEAGTTLRERRHAEEVAHREQELAQAQALAAAEHQRAEVERAAHLRLRRLTIGIAIATLVALAAAVFAVRAQRDAEQNARVAHSRQVIAQAINVMHSQPDLALLLGVEALRLDDSAGSKMALYSELDIHPMLTGILHGQPSQLYSIGLQSTREVLVSNEQGAVVAWDIASGEQPTVVDDDEQLASAAAVSPDGLRFATTNGERITVWDAETFSPLIPLDEVGGNVEHLSFTRDGNRLLSAGDDGRVLLWDLPSGTVVHQWLNDKDRPIYGPISPDGALVLLGDSMGTEDGLDIWDIGKDARVGQPLLGHKDTLHGYAVSPDGGLVATASFDGSVRLWDTATGAASGGPLLGHAGRVLFVAFSPDGRVLATGGTDSQVILWDVTTKVQLGQPLVGHSNSARVGRFSADGSLLATGDESGNVLLWDVSRLHVLLGHTDRVRSLAISSDQSTLATSGFDRRLIVWDAQTLAQRQNIQSEHTRSIISAEFSPDGSTLVTIDAGGYVLFWNTETWDPRFPIQQVTDQPLIGLSFSPDGQTLAAGSFDGVVRLWDVATGQLLPRSIPAYDTGWVLSVRFDPDGKLLATGGGDGVIKLWDVEGGQAKGEPLVGHTNRVTDLLFSADGATLTSASADGSVRFWDVASGQEVGDSLIAGSDQVWSISAAGGSPPRLLALHLDGSVADWDITTRTLNRPLVHTHMETEEMKVGANGAVAHIASMGPTAQVLALRNDDWVTEACRIANRVLSEEEWRKYMHELPYAPACH